MIEMQRAQRIEPVSSAFKAELRRDGLVTDPENYSFHLSAKKMTVNGKKQPEEIHQKYLKIYSERTGHDIGKSGSVNISESN